MSKLEKSEGVEKVEQYNFLQEHGCNEVQGYYFCKPLPPESFEQFVRERLALKKVV